MRPFALFIILYLFSPVCLQARTWTNSQGRTVEAEFDHEEGASVVLKLANGKTVPVPLATLSPADQAFVASTRKPAAPAAPPPEPLPPPDRFPVFDYGVAATEGTTSNGRSVHRWGPLKVIAPQPIERSIFEKALRPVLGGLRVLEHLGFPSASLADKKLPLVIAVYPNSEEVGKAAGQEKAWDNFIKPDGRVFCSASFLELANSASASTEGDTDGNLQDRRHAAAVLYSLHDKLSYLPTWLHEGVQDYAKMLPWVEEWPQHSHARIAMQTSLADIANKKAFLITPSLIDNVLSQPLASFRKDDAKNHAAALIALFYLRHLHGDGTGSELKSALATMTTQHQAWRTHLAQLAAYNEVLDAIKADPRTQKLADGRLSFSSNHVLPEEPSAPPTPTDQQAAIESLNKSLLALLGAKPGETIVAGLIKAGFVQGIASDSGEIVSGGTSPNPAAPAGDPANDLTPDYSKVKPAKPHLPLINRTWPLEIMVSTSAMNVAIVPSKKTISLYRVGRFQFETGPGLSLPVIKEIARVFTSLEELVERMPWDIKPTPPKGEWFVAKLYESRAEYDKIAPPSSGGFYDLKEKVFHVPYQSLGIGLGMNPTFSNAQAFNSDTLVHELTHMMMDHIIPHMPIWTTEGSAEYVEIIPFTNNAMRPADLTQALKAYIGKMVSYPEKIQSNYSFKANGKRMTEVLHMSRQAWHGSAGTAKPNESTPSEPQNPKDISARQHDLYMHACLLFYYFMHLDSPQRGDPMLPFIDKVSDSLSQWQLYEKAIGQYRERFTSYTTAWEAFAKLPGVTQLPGGKIQYPQGMKPPASPVLPGAPVDLSKLPDRDPGLAYLDTLVKGRSDEQLAEAFRAGFAKIGVTLR